MSFATVINSDGSVAFKLMVPSSKINLHLSLLQCLYPGCLLVLLAINNAPATRHIIALTITKKREKLQTQFLNLDEFLGGNCLACLEFIEPSLEPWESIIVFA